MRADALKYRFEGPVENKRNQDKAKPSLMTPARRAALDALEREFNELLKAQSRQ